MRIFADLNALERCMDLYDQQERTVSFLMQSIKEERSLLPPEALERQRFFEEQLSFLRNEKKRIRDRRSFMQDTLYDLRSAKIALDDSLNAALGILSIDK